MGHEPISRGNSVKGVGPTTIPPAMVTSCKPRHKRLHYGGDTDDAEVGQSDPWPTVGVTTVALAGYLLHANLVKQECQMVVVVSES